MSNLEGKVAFITGAARGQGRSHAIRLAEEGADIIVVDLCAQLDSVAYPLSTADDLAETVKLVEDRGRSIVAAQGDVRNRSSLQRVLDAGLDRFGHVDVVVANAGIMPICGSAGQQVAAWHDAVDTMLTGVYNTVEVVLPSMIERNQGGSIIITSSTFGLRAPVTSRGAASPGMLGYVAAKHGIVGLMRAYANALASVEIRVNTIHPTSVNTPMIVNEAFGAWVQEHPEMVAALQNPMPTPSIEPSDVSNAVAWLASEEARYVTGTTMAVDAGFSNA